MQSSTNRDVLGTKFICRLVLVISLVASSLATHAPLPAVASNGSINLMTRNLYVGAAFDPLLNAPTPDDIPERVAQVYSTILSSRFPCRAETIADEIVQSQPDLVGLQEAALLRVQSPCGSSIQNPPQPISIAIDYLQILLDALERRGARLCCGNLRNQYGCYRDQRNGGYDSSNGPGCDPGAYRFFNE